MAIWYFFSIYGWWPSWLNWAYKHHPQQSEDDRQAQPLWCKPCLRLAQDDGTPSHFSIAGLLGADCRLMGSHREITSFSLMPFLLLQNLLTKKCHLIVLKFCTAIDWSRSFNSFKILHVCITKVLKKIVCSPNHFQGLSKLPYHRQDHVSQPGTCIRDSSYIWMPE